MKNLLQHPITDREKIEQLIPQKPPFVMVDSLFEAAETTSVSGFTIVPENLLSAETYFSEAGLIENMAQSVALHGGFLASLQSAGKPKIGFLGAIKSLEIFELPRINSSIKTHVELIHDIMDVKLSEVTVKNEQGKILAKSTIKTATLAV